MAFIPVPNTVNVFLEYQLPGNVLAGNSIWILDQEAGVTSPRVAALVALIDAWDAAHWAARRANDITLRRINARDMSIQDGEVVDFTLATPRVGTVPSPSLSANVSFCYSLRTGLAGRTRRGRLYAPPPAEAEVTGSYISQASVTASIAALDNLRTVVLTPNNFTWVVASRFVNGAPRTVGETTPITSIIAVDLRVDTQRRRLPGEGS